jgi:Tfp pilus assembly protein PilF
MSSKPTNSAEIAKRMLDEGYQYHLAGNLGEAIQLYQSSINFYPTAEAHTFLGWAYSMQGQLEEAIEQCKMAIQLDAGYGNAYNDIGVYLLAMGNSNEAESWLKKATNAPRYDTPAVPYMNLARIYLAKGQTFRALRALKRGWETDRSYLPILHRYQELLATVN